MHLHPARAQHLRRDRLGGLIIRDFAFRLDQQDITVVGLYCKQGAPFCITLLLFRVRVSALSLISAQPSISPVSCTLSIRLEKYSVSISDQAYAG